MSDDELRLITTAMIVTAASTLLVMTALSVWTYLQLPADAQVPVHWNAAGDVDRYAGRLQGTGLLVLITAGVVGLLLALPRIEPRRANLRRSATAYRVSFHGVLAVLGGIHLMTLATALGRDVNLSRTVPLVIGGLLVVIGNVLPKTRSTFTIGIRTPWTLSSEHTWRRTHRVAGWAFVGVGLLTIVIGLLWPASAMGVIGPTAAVLALGVMVYSYIVWRSAPDRGTGQPGVG